MGAKNTFVRLMGGLGNQMFQYAAARHYARITKSALYIDTSVLQYFETPREYALGAFPLHGKLNVRRVVLSSDGKAALMYPAWTQTHDLHAIPVIGRLVDAVAVLGATRIQILREASWGDDHSDWDNVILVGYWQSPRYFAGSADEVRRDFSFSSIAMDRGNAYWMDRIGASESVAVHVRRGDYLSPEIASKFGLCSAEYFCAAMTRMREQLTAPRFFVFSDDMEWCRGNLNGADVDFVDVNSASAPVQDLRLITACRHQVISNSSFSWWAAWLAAKPNLVIAPHPWYRDSTPAPDLLAAWMVLDRVTGAEISLSTARTG